MARIKTWSDDLASVADNDPQEAVLEQAQRSHFEMRDYVLDVVGERARCPGPDLLSALIAAEEAGERLTPDELFGMVQVLLIAGQETTTNLIGNAIHALLRHPDALAQLRAHSALMTSAIEECARWDSPVQSRTRVTTADLELHDQTVPAGQTLLLLLGAANRDPRAFAEPDRFDIARAHNHHVAFGHGVHYCVGAALARLETRTALEAMLARWPALALADGPRPETETELRTPRVHGATPHRGALHPARALRAGRRGRRCSCRARATSGRARDRRTRERRSHTAPPASRRGSCAAAAGASRGPTLAAPKGRTAHAIVMQCSDQTLTT